MIEQVRFACPQCRFILQTGRDKIGYDIACPNCAYRFKLVEPAESNISEPASSPPAAAADSGSSDRESWSPPAAVKSSPPPYPMPPQPSPASPSGYYQPAFTCPYCGSHARPFMKSQVSQAGWIVFALLLVSTCVFCWLGLLIRDRYQVCSGCHVRLD